MVRKSCGRAGSSHRPTKRRHQRSQRHRRRPRKPSKCTRAATCPSIPGHSSTRPFSCSRGRATKRQIIRAERRKARAGNVEGSAAGTTKHIGQAKRSMSFVAAFVTAAVAASGAQVFDTRANRACVGRSKCANTAAKISGFHHAAIAILQKGLRLYGGQRWLDMQKASETGSFAVLKF